MKILSFDSSTKTASVALSQDERVLAVTTVLAGQTHSEILLPMAEDLLRECKVSFSDIDAYAVVCGPGSFTGVRIGVATVKGLAFGRNVPCVGISSLEGLAYNLSGLSGIFVPVIDCRRDECYTALFSSNGEAIERKTEDMQMKIADLAPLLKEYEGVPIYLVGDAYERACAILSSLGVALTPTPVALRAPSASSLCKIAHARIIAGEYESDLTLSATYLKATQAERERLEKEQRQKEI